MGLFDNLIQRLATEVVKAAPQNSGIIGQDVPLQRDPNWASVPFGPATPLVPSSINPLSERGKPDPRRWEFEVAQNINVTGGRLIPFHTLRQVADMADIARRCIEVLKNKVVGLEWDIVLTDVAVEKIVAEQGVSQIRAASIAKEQFADELNRARDFWFTPDVSNGLDFSSWIKMVLEDLLVLDAVGLWPQKSVGGDLIGLQVLDGSTIKPLIDDRGMRPTPPNAAFQQILYGFPRSEFTAPTETLEADGEFTSDELSYWVMNRRTNSVYGYSPVERALPLLDIYLRRQQWLRAEYTDGVMPEVMFKTDANFGNNPELLRAYENIFNDDLAGQTEQRKRARLLPSGLDPVQFDGYGEKFSEKLDEYLVTAICGHFGVLPTEIGILGKTGLGGSSVHDGQAESSEVLSLVPLTKWLARHISLLSYNYLGMPRELEFKFQPSARHDVVAKAQAEDVRLKNGTLSINEARAQAGLPLLDAEEADTPVFVAGTAAFVVGDGGWAALTPSEQSPAEPAASAAEEPEKAPAEEPAETDRASKGMVEYDRHEVRQFVRYLKRYPTEPFIFRHVPAEYADTLNKFLAVKDFDGARWYAERYDG